MNKTNLSSRVDLSLFKSKNMPTFLDLNFCFCYIKNMSKHNFQKSKKLCITKKVAPPQNKKILKPKKTETECINSSRLDLSCQKVLQKNRFTF